MVSTKYIFCCNTGICDIIVRMTPLCFISHPLKENTNIEAAAKCLVDHILAHEENITSNTDPDVVALPGYNNNTKERVRARCMACSKFWIYRRMKVSEKQENM